MYNVQKNNYFQKPKSSIVYTPKEVSEFIFELLRDKILQDGLILDPCSGMGNLLEPWKKDNYETYGIDNDENSTANFRTDFLKVNNWWNLANQEPALILCNPPFNGYGHKLGSEVWLDKIIELFGKDIPIVLFVPIGFRLNLTVNSSRWKKLNNGDYPVINSIISLPKDCFKPILFHSEILIFNIKGLQGHYLFNLTSEIEQRTPI